MCGALAEFTGSVLALIVLVFLIFLAIFIGLAIAFGFIMLVIAAFVWLITNPIFWIVLVIVLLIYILK